FEQREWGRDRRGDLASRLAQAVAQELGPLFRLIDDQDAHPDDSPPVRLPPASKAPPPECKLQVACQAFWPQIARFAPKIALHWGAGAQARITLWRGAPCNSAIRRRLVQQHPVQPELRH